MANKKLELDSIVYKKGDPLNIRYKVHAEQEDGMYIIYPHDQPTEAKKLKGDDFLTVDEWKLSLNAQPVVPKTDRVEKQVSNSDVADAIKGITERVEKISQQEIKRPEQNNKNEQQKKTFTGNDDKATNASQYNMNLVLLRQLDLMNKQLDLLIEAR